MPRINHGCEIVNCLLSVVATSRNAYVNTSIVVLIRFEGGLDLSGLLFKDSGIVYCRG